MSFSPKQCLIVGPSWVGDMMMAQSLFILLKQRFPELQIDVLAPTWSKPLLEAMPEVCQAIEFPFGHGELALKKRYQFAQTLRPQGYDWSILLPNSLKSALVPFWAKIPVRTGFKGEMRYGLLNDLRHLDKSILTMTVQRFAALALDKDDIPQHIPNPKLNITTTQRQQVAQTYNLNLQQPLLALCPGAEYGSAKRWPETHFASVAQQMLKQGWQVCLLGSGKDTIACQTIASQLPDESLFDLSGKTTLEEAMTVLSLAQRVISNDSGLMHLAAAVGSHVIALYGSSDPNFTPPLSDHTTVLHLDLECSPCFKRECPYGHLDCLNNITPAMVLSHLV